MSYTVKKLATLSGISIRTLRHYDTIGLLKPAYYGDNHYRYYEEEQILMLQQILFYRELGFPLNEIQRIISCDDFNTIDALMSHKQILAQSLDRTQKLIKTIDHTIAHLRGEITMRNEELFTGFAHTFAFQSFVTAFSPGHEHLLDQYFASDLIMFNHAMSKQLDLNDLKSRLPNLQTIFKDLKSEVKDVIAEGDRIAFRVEQHALFFKHNPDGVHVKLDVMNLYKLESSKVKEWQIWVNITEI
ncbi:MAG TPA: MerR family transcriptional regulator [Gammaproteobacteria bacterium]|nr:MerR family transcriptional regulator [Gammaproteobacteria bacterium]